MGNNEIYWAIFSNKTLLPFTIRTTKKQCVLDRLHYLNRDSLFEIEACKKVVINEFNTT